MIIIVILLIFTISAGAYQYDCPCQDVVGDAYRPWRMPFVAESPYQYAVEDAYRPWRVSPSAGYYGPPYLPGTYNPYRRPSRDYRPTPSNLLFKMRSNAKSGEREIDVETMNGIDSPEDMSSRMEMENPVPEEYFDENSLPEAVEERSPFPDPRFNSEEEDLPSTEVEAAVDPTS